MSSNFAVDFESKLAVGSSASINLGFEASDLATATLYC